MIRYPLSNFWVPIPLINHIPLHEHLNVTEIIVSINLRYIDSPVQLLNNKNQTPTPSKAILL